MNKRFIQAWLDPTESVHPPVTRCRAADMRW